MALLRLYLGTDMELALVGLVEVGNDWTEPRFQKSTSLQRHAPIPRVVWCVCGGGSVCVCLCVCVCVCVCV
jgi:hypothetical protein